MKTSLDPVNPTLSTFMCPVSVAPAVGPNPGTTFITPAGNPASFASAAKQRAYRNIKYDFK